MKRKIDDKLSEWYSRSDHRPLIIVGCRQIGKTYSVREFSTRYPRSIYINFEMEPEKKYLFDGSLAPDELMSRIFLSADMETRGERALLIFDEIQNCPAAYSSLKGLSTLENIDVIALGSFLGVRLDENVRLSPLGYVDVLNMYPMDFEEFLWAVGIKKELTDRIGERIASFERIDEYFNLRFTDYYKRYLAVGGMPAAVKIYAETKDYVAAAEELDRIIRVLMRDAGKYSEKAGRSKINACLLSIPSQLARESKRFVYSDIEKMKHIGAREYGNALDWLETAGLVLRCENVSEPVLPFSARRRRESFKLYLCDTGILLRLMPDAAADSIVLGDPYCNYGTFMENSVACALASKGYPLFFYSKADSTLEIDFLARMNGKVGLIEVKSGRNKRAKSLSTMLKERNRNRIGIKIMDSNIEEDETGALHLPIYAASFMEPLEITAFPPAEDPGEMDRRFLEMNGP